jgi:pimeloyl-ACP methyl ester carboxylesterase
LFEQLAPVFEHYQHGETVEAVEMFLQGVGRPNVRQIVEHTVPGGFEQAVRDADTFFQLELPSIQTWAFTRAHAERVTQPLQFVIGAESIPLMTEVRELVHAWFPQAQDLVLTGVSHCLQMEDAAGVADGLRTFFRANAVSRTS